MNQLCEEFQKIHDEFNERVEEFQKIYNEVKKEGSVNLDGGKNFFKEIEVLKGEIMEKMSENRQLRFFDSSYGVWKEIEENVLGGDYLLQEIEMQKDGSIVLNVSSLILSIDTNNKVKAFSEFQENEEEYLEKFFVNNNDIVAITEVLEEKTKKIYIKKSTQDKFEEISEIESGEKIKSIKKDSVCFSDGVLFALQETLSSDKREIIFKEDNQKANVLEGIWDMNIESLFTNNDGEVMGLSSTDSYSKIFRVKKDENDEFFIEYEEKELPKSVKLLKNQKLVFEKYDEKNNEVDFYYMDKDGNLDKEKILSTKKGHWLDYEVFVLDNGAFGVSSGFDFDENSDCKIHFVNPDGNVEIIEKIQNKKVKGVYELKLQADNSLTGYIDIEGGEEGTFMFDGEKYVFV